MAPCCPVSETRAFPSARGFQTLPARPMKSTRACKNPSGGVSAASNPICLVVMMRRDQRIQAGVIIQFVEQAVVLRVVAVRLRRIQHPFQIRHDFEVTRPRTEICHGDFPKLHGVGIGRQRDAHDRLDFVDRLRQNESPTRSVRPMAGGAISSGKLPMTGHDFGWPAGATSATNSARPAGSRRS